MWRRKSKADRKRALQESRIALYNANESLLEVQSRTKEVRKVHESLVDLRRQNHFAEKLQIIMEGNGC